MRLPDLAMGVPMTARCPGVRVVRGDAYVLRPEWRPDRDGAVFDTLALETLAERDGVYGRLRWPRIICADTMARDYTTPAEYQEAAIRANPGSGRIGLWLDLSMYTTTHP